MSRSLPPLAFDQRQLTTISAYIFSAALRTKYALPSCCKLLGCSDNDDCTEITRQQGNYQLPNANHHQLPAACYLLPSIETVPAMSATCNLFKEKVCVLTKRAANNRQQHPTLRSSPCAHNTHTYKCFFLASSAHSTADRYNCKAAADLAADTQMQHTYKCAQMRHPLSR
ncbi:unnamed protein product [Ceratitis capitata]|uniref:(Mediterranean fruit fly) hypothetical protein n=1 Tax=Ceratitis capitata TaxID=7213 RepID=A0A811UTN1_CERCA|nr:unnamed protein product [Ceratitis capitata]